MQLWRLRVLLVRRVLSQRMYHLECHYQLTPYRKFGKMTAEPQKTDSELVDNLSACWGRASAETCRHFVNELFQFRCNRLQGCLLYTSDAADDLLCVDLGGRRIIKKKKKNKT